MLFLLIRNFTCIAPLPTKQYLQSKCLCPQWSWLAMFPHKYKMGVWYKYVLVTKNSTDYLPHNNHCLDHIMATCKHHIWQYIPVLTYIHLVVGLLFQYQLLWGSFIIFNILKHCSSQQHVSLLYTTLTPQIKGNHRVIYHM